MNKILTIAYFTFKEIIKSRILLNVFFLGLALLLVTYIASQFTYGVPSRVALDFGLGVLSISSVGIAIFMGVSLLSKEIETRTVYMIISRPTRRYYFIVGKIIGLIGILALNILILSVQTLIVYGLLDGSFDPLIFWAIFFIFLESTIVLLTVCLLSLLGNNILSVLFTILIYIAGHAINETQLTTFVQNRPFLEGVLNLYHFILPAFYKLNLKDFVLYNQNLELSYLLKSTLYGVIYCSMLLLCSTFVFNKKNLD